MKSFSGKKEKHWLRQMSRNVLSNEKSITALSLNRSVAKSTTPLKLMSLQKSVRADTLASTREKALLQQNVELKKKNNELVRILKKSKELIKSEINKYKAENLIMKKFTEAAWVWAEPKLEEKLKEEVRPILLKQSTKMSSIATNSTDHCSAEGFKEERSDKELLKRKLSQKTLKSASLIQRLNDDKLKNKKLNQYLKFLEKGCTVEEKALMVDSENVESDEDEVICTWINEDVPVHDEVPVAIPTFIKSLGLRNTFKC